MGRRSRRREGKAKAPRSTTDYTDSDGNVLTLRDELSAGTRAKLDALEAKPAASAEVAWQISGLPLEGQRELLGRYRMARADERRWVREVLEEHLRTHTPS